MVRLTRAAGALAALLVSGVAAEADDGCAGAAGCPALRSDLGTYGDGEWHAATVAAEDDRPGCVVYAHAKNAEPARGLWLFVYPDHLHYDPDEPLPPNEFVNISAGELTMPMALSRGTAFVPLTFPIFARAVGDARALTLQIGVRRPLDAQEFLTWSMDGFRDAFRRIADECGFDPGHVLGED